MSFKCRALIEIDPRSLSDVIILLEVLERTLYSGGFAGRGEQSTPGTAGLAGPYPHAGSDADYERQEESEKGNFEAGDSIYRAWDAILRCTAVQRGQQRQFSPSRPHRGFMQYADETA